jgi:hypothetical protein
VPVHVWVKFPEPACRSLGHCALKVGVQLYLISGGPPTGILYIDSREKSEG